jgi:hypothetical protein
MRLPSSCGVITYTTCQLDGSKYELKTHGFNHLLTTKTYQFSLHKYSVLTKVVAQLWIGQRHFEEEEKYGGYNITPNMPVTLHPVQSAVFNFKMNVRQRDRVMRFRTVNRCDTIPLHSNLPAKFEVLQ